jgi:curli biogenesis system outer membrane secretion channel CsgG
MRIRIQKGRTNHIFSLCLITLIAAPCIFADDTTAPAELYGAISERGFVTLAVLDFVNSDGTVSTLGRQLRDEAIKYFSSSNPKMKLVERERLDAIISELALHSTGYIREKDSVGLGELIGADVLIIGTLAKYNRSLITFSTRIVDIRNGIVLSSKSVQIKGAKYVRLYDKAEQRP